MNNEKFSAIMGLIVPEVIRLITENYPYVYKLLYHNISSFSTRTRKFRTIGFFM